MFSRGENHRSNAGNSGSSSAMGGRNGSSLDNLMSENEMKNHDDDDEAVSLAEGGLFVPSKKNDTSSGTFDAAVTWRKAGKNVVIVNRLDSAEHVATKVRELGPSFELIAQKLADHRMDRKFLHELNSEDLPKLFQDLDITSVIAQKKLELVFRDLRGGRAILPRRYLAEDYDDSLPLVCTCCDALSMKKKNEVADLNNPEFWVKKRGFHRELYATRRRCECKFFGFLDSVNGKAYARRIGLNEEFPGLAQKDFMAYVILKAIHLERRGKAHKKLGVYFLCVEVLSAALVPVLIGFVTTVPDKWRMATQIIAIVLSVAGTIAHSFGSVYQWRRKARLYLTLAAKIIVLFDEFENASGENFAEFSQLRDSREVKRRRFQKFSLEFQKLMFEKTQTEDDISADVDSLLNVKGEGDEEERKRMRSEMEMMRQAVMTPSKDENVNDTEINDDEPNVPQRQRQWRRKAQSRS